ncbi:GCN5-related N-acetyltransferase [Cronobacter sakazakii 701]|nr:GCN5-related N-acetyltransferase [Cronobacter sakazakii 701]
MRIAQQAAPGVRHIAHQVAVARKVTAGAARHRALRDVFFHAWQFRHGLIPELRLQARALAHFAEVPQQPEAGDIRHRPHAVDLCEISARFIHGAHHFCRKILMFRAQQRFFLSGGQHADTQRLGEKEFATRLGGAVFLHALGWHHAGDGETENRLRRVDGVAARQRDARLLTRKAPAFHDLARDFRRERVNRPAEDRNRHDRFAAHRVDVADGVGRSDTAKIERVVHDGHEEIRGADNARAVAEIVHRRVVARFVADKQVGVDKLRLIAVQDGFQHFRGNFTTATCSVAVLGQTNRLLTHGPLLVWSESGDRYRSIKRAYGSARKTGW